MYTHIIYRYIYIMYDQVFKNLLLFQRTCICFTGYLQPLETLASGDPIFFSGPSDIHMNMHTPNTFKSKTV